MQQINLFHDQFKPQQVLLPARQILLLTLLFVVMLSVISVYSYQKNVVLEKVTNALQYVVQQEANTTLIKPLLDVELIEIQQLQQQKEHLLNYLSDQTFGNQYGFSSTLVTLSQQVIKNVWLTDISLLNGGQDLILQGKTSQVSQIPVYIDSLAASERFTGKQFSAFQLQQPADDADIYTFQLNTAMSKP